VNDSDEIDQHSGCEMTGLFDAPVWAAVRDGKAGARHSAADFQVSGGTKWCDLN